MANFKEAHGIVMKIEGGYANDPDDKGGETYKGISRVNFPNWKGWKLIDQHKTSPAGFEFSLQTDAVLESLVLDFYKANFWDVLNLDYVTTQEIATELYDTGVNCGSGTAGKILQEALNVNNNNGAYYPDVTVDGKIGPVTIKTLNGYGRQKDIYKTINILKGAHYIDICEKNPKQEKFYRSWLSRVGDLN